MFLLLHLWHVLVRVKIQTAKNPQYGDSEFLSHLAGIDIGIPGGSVPFRYSQTWVPSILCLLFSPWPCPLAHGQGWVLSQEGRRGVEETLVPKWHTSVQLTPLTRETVTQLHPTANHKAVREQNADRYLSGQ